MKLCALLPRVAVGLAAVLGAGHAPACLPPPEGWVPPSVEERARVGAQWAMDIVYGVVVRGTESGRQERFRVLHVYKGPLRPGAVLDVERGWGLNPPMCPGMMMIPPVFRGDYGVIAFRSDRPALNFLGENELEVMFREGLIRSARAEAASENDPR
jgi:hypothetical protein